MIRAHRGCMALIDQLDPSDLGQLGLIVRLQELCDLLEGDMDQFVD